MHKIIIAVVSLCYSAAGYAEKNQQVNIHGVIKDAYYGQPLSGVNIVILPEGSVLVADSLGQFTFTPTRPSEKLLFVLSHTGYLSDTLELKNQSELQTILLMPVSANLEDVTVNSTSQRRLAKENPIAMVTVHEKQLDQSIASNIMDALIKNVPGLKTVKTGPNISKPFIRGLGYNRVLTLYDGLRQEGQQWGDEHGIEVDPYSIAHAEVIKGPASLMYGSDALAGVVSLYPFIPKTPDGVTRGRLTSEYQSNNGLIGNGLRFYNRDNHWYWIGSGSYRLAKNYKNALDGRVYNTNFKEGSAAFSLGHTSGSGHTAIHFTLFNDLQGIPDGSRDSLTRKFTRQVKEAEMDDIKNRPTISSQVLNSYQLSALHQNIQHYRIYTKSEYRLGKGNLASLFAWQQNSRKEFSHPKYPNQAGMAVKLNTLSYDLKYSTPMQGKISVSLGSNGMYQANKNGDATDFPIPDYKILDMGGFIFGKWKRDRLTISGGVRYDLRTVRNADFYLIKDEENGFDRKAETAEANAILQFPAFNKVFTGISYSLGAAYIFNEHFNLKANTARGYRAPNISELASNGLDPGAHIIYKGNRAAKPEFSLEQDISFELDFKQVQATLSLFHNQISNYIYFTELVDDNGQSTLDPQGNKTLQYRQSNARLYGLELNSSIYPFGDQNLFWSGNLTLIYGINSNPAYQHQGTQGRYLPLIAPASVLNSITQQIKFKNSVLTDTKVSAELEINATQNRFLGLFGTESATPGYTLLNLAAATTVTLYKHKFDMHLAVNNVTDHVYQSNLSRLKYLEYYDKSPGNHKGIFGMGRNICVKLIYRWGER